MARLVREIPFRAGQEVAGHCIIVASFCDTIMLGSSVTVQKLEPKVTLGIGNVDTLTTPEEVIERLRARIGKLVGDLKVIATVANRR